jgi:hypothetical protein
MTHMRYKFRNGVVISIVNLRADNRKDDFPLEAWVVAGSTNTIENANMHLRDALLPTQPEKYTEDEMGRALHLWCYHMQLVSVEVA